jgi:hypothetical protein
LIIDSYGKRYRCPFKGIYGYEAKSCSMDFGCITPEYVHRMWGGTVKLEEIEKAMAEIKKQ